MSNITLTVNGRAYSGWTSVRVTRTIEAIAGSFALKVTDRVGPTPVDHAQVFAESGAIRVGDPCVVTLGAEPVITGEIDVVDRSYDADAHDVSVSGRDRTGQLCDVSANWMGSGRRKNATPTIGEARSEYYGVFLVDLVRHLVKPFSIDVRVAPGLDPERITLGPAANKDVRKIVVNPGDSVFDLIDRECRLVGVLPVSDGRGGLVLTRPDMENLTVTALIEGMNILSASATIDNSRRYYEYIAYGCRSGKDDNPGASVSARSYDHGVRHDRVLMVRVEGAASIAMAQRRAQWEAAVRAARALSVTVTVQGWTQGNSDIWPINALVPLRSPTLGINEAMLITETTSELSLQRGTTTTLRLTRPDAYRPQPDLGSRTNKEGDDESSRALGILQ